MKIHFIAMECLDPQKVCDTNISMTSFQKLRFNVLD